ncbi:unnamed protein product [Pylaiella littoralis]
MSIQLDGHVTYPSQQQDCDGGKALPTSADLSAAAAATAVVDGSSSRKQQGKGKGATAAAAANADVTTAFSTTINWDGFWHYSKQKSRAGGPELSAFKYSFVGPTGNDPPAPAPAPAGSGTASTVAAVGTPQPASKSATPTPTPSFDSKNSSRSAGGDTTAAGAIQQLPSHAGGQTTAAAAAAAGESVALAATPAATSSSSPAESPAVNALSNGSRATPAGDAPPLVPTPSAAAGNDGTGVDNKQTMLLYGPGGDGRLPSGEWSGYFIVNYGRGVEVKVEETFSLDFGPKSPRNSQAPEPAVATAAAGAGAGAAGEPTAPSLTGTASAPADKLHAQPQKKIDAGYQLPTQATPAGAVPAVIQTSTSPTVHVPIAPVVRVSGRGQNKYGEFTLTGGHERATGRLDLTRFYYEKPKEKSGARGSGAAGSRSERSGRGGSHQKKKRLPPPGALPPQPPGPSLAERRTKRTRCPNQRLLDDETVSSHGTLSESASNGGGGSGGSGSGSSNKRKSSSGSNDAAGAGAVGVANLSISVAGSGGGGGSGAAGADSFSSGGGSTPKSRKPRDRERDLFMEQRRREKRKAEEAVAAAKSSMSASTSTSSSNSLRVAAEISVPPESSAAELAARAKAGREVLAAIGNASDDPVEKEAFAHMELEQATLEAEAAAAAAGAQAAALAAEKLSADISGTGSWGGSTDRRTARGPGRSKRHSVERWEELTLDRETGEYYEGGWYRGRRHGKGLCVYANKRMYEGDWRAGKEHGVGKILGPDREVIYEGELADGKLCGKGRYTDGTGAVYDGEWKDSAMHGRGVYTFPVCPSSTTMATASTAAAAAAAAATNGAQSNGVAGDAAVAAAAAAGAKAFLGTMFYDGEFKDNARCGRGLQTWPGGSYDGEWLDDAKHGRGVLRTDDGFMYDGQWVDDLAEGRGMCIHPDGQRYEGVFRGGKKEGRGTLAFANGASYEGRFRDDAIDGQGMLQIPRPVKDDMGGWMIPIQFQSRRYAWGGGRGSWGHGLAKRQCTSACLVPLANRCSTASLSCFRMMCIQFLLFIFRYLLIAVVGS